MRNFITILAIIACSYSTCYSQLLTWSPDFILEASNPVDITVDANKGNQGLKDYASTTDVFVHIGVITNFSTSSSDWKYSKFTWATTPVAAQAVWVSANKWKYTITGGLRTYFGMVNPSEKIIKIAILFRSGNGSRVQRNGDGSDMYVPVYEPGLQARIINPLLEPKYVPTIEPMSVQVGQSIPVTAISNQTATLKLYLNGTQFGSTATNVTSINANAVIAAAGTQKIVVEAYDGSTTKFDTIQFVATANTVIQDLPPGMTDGINYHTGGTSATLVLYAPGKSNIAVIGEFNGWSPTTPYQMKRTTDGNRFWVQLTGLTAGVEYAYQYLIDGSLKVADYNAEKILDPWNDQYIPAVNYPGLKAYPTGSTTGIVSILQTAKPTFAWQANSYTRPDKRNLIIYELLVRDFVAAQNWQTLKDTLSYLKRLGINAIEVMPFNEFEGNDSWGYNPSFYFAPDKMYGTETALKQFIDECHKQGIAVIMDIALNHSFGQSPTVQMYWNSALNRPAANNPWHNEVAKHPYNVGYDFNHESQATKDLVARVSRHWLTNYKIDGFRWDLSKGFTQTNSCTTTNCDGGSEVNNWGNYDAGRITTWKRIYDSMQIASTNSYCILEHFGANNEEIELSNYGMLLWGNSNYNYNEATMGYVSTSNFQYGIFTNRGWTNPHLITYQESHDEERLMYKNLNFGNSANPGHDVKNLNTALRRNEMAAAFWAVTPAPKLMWQFGELGYDFSINTCENLTVNNNCRLSKKPIRWDYQSNANRMALFNVYSKLFKLRSVPNFLPTFVTSNITYNLNGGFKSLIVSSDSLKIVVIGNFDVNAASASVTFPQSGIWYNYLGGSPRIATGSAETINLQPGEYYVYTNKDAAPIISVLPVKLLSFEGKRNKEEIALTWKTASEINVSHFEMERSFSGNDFISIGRKPAVNAGLSQAVFYDYVDQTPEAKKAASKIYYRLKMVDKDNSYEYSKTISINPLSGKTDFSIYPNPVDQNSKIEYSINESGQVHVEIISALGQKIFSGNEGLKPAGVYQLDFQSIINNTGKLKPGIYLLRLQIDGQSSVKTFFIQ